ncbi:carcinoembryonic antigen-related cell adhesion molecule 8 isoform X3 [Xenopus laevis]|uniref:Carcinoembryonic antigen-related cell adhesion molecule 8 isoform X3 n=1 Tax=Xenopus laevis TaxID=8355 RepID=A0A8J1L7J0_XENLA|nr:carcinoembryonic antigen-related cell adhesion molecule 8 isoform X3 [Xenopus laevis]
MAREKVTGAQTLCMRRYLLTVCLSVWMDSAHGIGVQLIPQYPVVSQSVTLSVTGVTGTIRQFSWYKGSSVDANNQIFNVIPSLNSVTNGRQYFPRASHFPNGSLQISGLVPTDQGNYTVFIQTGETTAQHTVLLTVDEPVTSSVISTNNKEPQENEKVTLTCSTNNAEKILWSKNGVSLPPGLILSADNKTLTFSSVSRSDNGQYRCEASNTISKIISDPNTLTINYFEPLSDNYAVILAAIVCGCILGSVLIICATFLLYKRYVVPLKGQSGDRGEDPYQIYHNISNTLVAHPEKEETPYVGLDYSSQNMYSDLKL